MDISLFLAKFLGLYLALVIPAIILNRRHLDRVVAEFSNNLGLVYVAGFFHLTVGLIVILLHNVWTWDWRVLITILGWLGVIKGLVRFYFPEKLFTVVKRFNPKILFVSCFIFFVLGIYLVYIGFTSKNIVVL
ncbi:MAG: hypothetical protein CEO19_476 [Parcubacteria group bacterium Gr01-1014_73]|nr:MAG: hypothetical protein CEO19_476 [Parcubacteria group bacterium Gr01-1014_73]